MNNLTFKKWPEPAECWNYPFKVHHWLRFSLEIIPDSAHAENTADVPSRYTCFRINVFILSLSCKTNHPPWDSVQARNSQRNSKPCMKDTALGEPAHYHADAQDLSFQGLPFVSRFACFTSWASNVLNISFGVAIFLQPCQGGYPFLPTKCSRITCREQRSCVFSFHPRFFT